MLCRVNMPTHTYFWCVPPGLKDSIENTGDILLGEKLIILVLSRNVKPTYMPVILWYVIDVTDLERVKTMLHTKTYLLEYQPLASCRLERCLLNSWL